MQKTLNPAYPTELKTSGDNLRKVRLDRRLSQPEVAKLLKVSTDSVTGWELNRHEPPPKNAKAIIAFLGYFPFESKNCSLGKRLYYARLVTGMTQEEVGDITGCNKSNLRMIELDKREPQPKTWEKIEEFITTALEGIHGKSD